jgi:ELWxxDGT repeat protein
VTGDELWVSDGTAAGTREVKDTTPLKQCICAARLTSAGSML